MKSKLNPLIRHALAPALALAAFIPLHAATYYFDVNGTDAGSGVANAGVYNWSAANWAEDDTGTSATATRTWNDFNNPNNVIFVATADAGSANYTVNFMGGNNWVNSLIVNSGNLTINEATNSNMVLGSTTTWTVASGASLIVNPSANAWGTLNMNGNSLTVEVVDNATAAVAGVGNSSGNLTKTGTGLLALTAATTHTGATTLSDGTLRLGHANAVQSSTLTVNVNDGLKFSTGISTFLAKGLSGSGNILLEDTDSTAVTLSVGGSATSSNYTGVLSGSGGLTKTGSGTLALTKAKSYSGETTIESGVLELQTGFYQNPVVSGIFNVGSDAMLRVAGTTDAYRFNNVTVNFQSAGGGTLRGSSNTATGLNWYLLSSMTINTGGGARNVFDASGVGQNLNLNGQNLTFDVVRGTDATSDLEVSAVLWNSGSITKQGDGILTLTGANSYGGSTSIVGGTLAVVGSLPAASTVTVGSNGTLNPGTVGATGTLNAGTTNIAGTLAIDIDATASDQLLVTGNLNLTGSTLALNVLATPASTPYTIASYTGTLTGTLGSPPSGYTLNYVSGTPNIITLTKTTSDYNTWGAPYGLATGSEGLDLDNDGLTNFEEYAFGLIPNSGASANPIAVQLDKSTKKFSYTRRKPSLGTNLTYSVWFSENLVGWTKDTGATESTPVPSGDNETVEVTLSALPGNPLPAKLFIQVRAN